MLTTDDSFVFSRLVSKAKTLIAELPEVPLQPHDQATLDAIEAEELALHRNLPHDYYHNVDKQQNVFLASNESKSSDTQGQCVTPELSSSEDRGATSTVAALTGSLGGSHAMRESHELLALRRAALLDCVLAGQTVYRNVWARTTVDVLVEVVAGELSNRFLPSQRQLLQGLRLWVQAQKAGRQTLTAKDASADKTAFERSQAEWAKSTEVSHRGALGGRGDRKAETWLG
jgi:hypothetical protein